jgi:hypothetical protein
LEEKREFLLVNETSRQLSSLRIGEGIEVPLEERRIWSLGFLSKKECQDIMEEVYRCLKIVGAKWIVINAYKVKLRYVFSAREEESTSKSVVKIGLQMYKASDHQHILDLHKLSGDLLHYLDFCSLFFQEFNESFRRSQ